MLVGKDNYLAAIRFASPDTVPFPKHNPLPSLDRLADFRFPDPGVLAYPDRMRGELSRVDRSTHLVQMDILKPGGGYVCQPDQGLPGIPEENMRTLWETAREVGKYGPYPSRRRYPMP